MDLTKVVRKNTYQRGCEWSEVRKCTVMVLVAMVGSVMMEFCPLPE